MDAMRRSRKRKQSCLSPLHPLEGVFTRSKSQNSLHRDRSGNSRSDPTGRKATHAGHLPFASSTATCGKKKNHPFMDDDNDDDMLLIKDLRKKIKLRENEVSVGDDEETSDVFIKDLRARRVYSPQSVEKPCCKLIPDVKSSCGDEKMADLGFGLSSTIEVSDGEEEAAEGNKENEKLSCRLSSGQNKNDINSILCSIANEYRSDNDNDMYVDDITGKKDEQTKTSDVGVSCKAQNLDHENPKLFAETSKLQDSNGNNNGGNSKQIGESNEEVVQTTPPDVEIHVNLEANRHKRNQVDRVFHDMTPMAQENGSEGFHTKAEKGNNSAPESKSVFKSHLQRKLFKTPGSVSYRRLLPFLMNITKDDSGTPKLGHSQKDEKSVDAKQFQLVLPSQSQEASSGQLKTNSCSNELSYGNRAKSASSSDISVLPMQSDAKEVAYKCFSPPPVSKYTAEAEVGCKGKCFSDSTAVVSVDFHCVKAVASAVNNDFNKDSKNSNDHSDRADGNSDQRTSEQVGDFNDQCVLKTPPDLEMCHSSEVNAIEGNQVEEITHGAYLHVKDTNLTGSQENGQGLCPEPDKRNGSIPKSISVLEPRWQRRLFQTPGSVNYRRLLPYLKDITQDDSGTLTLHACQKREKSIDGRRLELPLSTESQAGSKYELKTDSCSSHDTVESSAMADITLGNPANELLDGDEPRLMSLQDIRELPMQVDAENVTQKWVAVTSTNEHVEEVEIICKGNSSVGSRIFTDDSCCAKNIANSVHSDEFKQVENQSTNQNSESILASKAQNLSHLNPDTSSTTCEKFSAEEKQQTLGSDEREQFKSPDKRKLVGRYPCEAQTIKHIYPGPSEASKDKAGSDLNSRSGDFLVSNQVHIPNKDPVLPLDFTSIKCSDTPEKSYKAENFQEGSTNGCLTVMLSKGSNEDISSCAGKIRNGFESKTASVLDPCSQIKLLKPSGSFNYRRLLPFLMNITKDNSCASGNDHSLRFEKHVALTPHPPTSATSSPVSPVDLNGRVCTDHCTSNSTKQQTAAWLPAPGKSLDDNILGLGSSAHVPELQSSNNSGKVTELQNGEAVYNGNIKSRSFPHFPVSVHKIDSPITSSFPIIKEVFFSEDVKSASHQSSVYSEVKGKNSILLSEKKPPETDEHYRNHSQPKVSGQSRIPAVGLKKGILKRNPRGCRGLCTCLNCASFRLHAERAFEFSRNQLLDAEELALDLIKEVSYLRSMLERNAHGDDHSALEINEVKEACRRASAAEQLAKDRLIELNDDLNIHCRITCLQQPRVRFANYVEERIILQDEQTQLLEI